MVGQCYTIAAIEELFNMGVPHSTEVSGDDSRYYNPSELIYS